jgi:rare lipoprotein A (peptidoglycan hydrolase)
MRRARALALALAAAFLLPSSASAGTWNHTAMTWYGPGYYGNRTACGQVMTRKLIGVAHRWLSCGTRIEIRYHHHHRIVSVVDRGPYGVAGLDLDATARLAIHLAGGHTNPHSMRNVRWRVVAP